MEVEAEEEEGGGGGGATEEGRGDGEEEVKIERAECFLSIAGECTPNFFLLRFFRALLRPVSVSLSLSHALSLYIVEEWSA